MKGVFIYATPASQIPYWDRRYDPFWATLQELDLPVGLHVALNEKYLGHQWIEKSRSEQKTLCAPWEAVTSLEALLAYHVQEEKRKRAE